MSGGGLGKALEIEFVWQVWFKEGLFLPKTDRLR